MATETRQEKIARLREMLASGLKSFTVEGDSTTYDIPSARRELMRLEEEAGTRRKRSRVITPAMGRR